MSFRATIAALVTWTGSMLGAIAYLASNKWRGVGDLSGMAVWSVIFAGIFYFTSRFVFGTRSDHNVAPLWICWSSIILGPALGVVCFAIAVAFVGGWRVSFPVFNCWALGGTLGLLAAATLARHTFLPAAIALSIVAVGIFLWANAILLRAG